MVTIPPKVKPGRVAICQICSNDDPVYNLKISEEVIRDAVKAGATACFLPEASDFIAPTQSLCYSLSHPLSSHPYLLSLRALARELSVYITVGIHELPEEWEEEEVKRESREGEKVFNTLVVVDAEGEVRGQYRKLHLFDVALKNDTSSIHALHPTPTPSAADSSLPNPSPSATNKPKKLMGESDRMLRGNSIHPPVDFSPHTNIPPVGLEICYDIRFPDLHAILVGMGAGVIVVPSAFTLRTGRDHWATLCKAIAIQYQVYLLGPAQAGAHSATRSSWGESLAFGPWGQQLARLPSIDDHAAAGNDITKPMPNSFAIFEVDREEVGSVRKQIPLAIQKRTDVYGTIGQKTPPK